MGSRSRKGLESKPSDGIGLRTASRLQPGTMAASRNTHLELALRGCRTAFGAILLFSLFINVLMLTGSIYMLQVYDRVLVSRSTETLVLLTAIGATALLALALLDVARGRVMVAIGEWLDRRLGGILLRGGIMGALNRSAAPSVQGLRDLTTLRTFLSGPTMFPIMDAPWTPVFLAVIFLLHPWLGWVSLAGALLLLVLAVINDLITRSALQRAGGASMGALRVAESAVQNADVVEAMGMRSRVIDRWRAANDQALGEQAVASRRGGVITGATKFLRQFLQVGILGVGAWLVIRHEMTAGSMIAASILMGRALAPVDQAVGAWRSAISTREAYKRIRAMLAVMPDQTETMSLPAPEGRLSVEGVSYIHPGMDKPVLHNISFELAPGETLALIGPSASGKTTLGRLLIGNHAPRAGHVRLDGMDVNKWNSEDLGDHIGYLPQDVELLGGTVHENISRLQETDPEAVVAAAQLAGVHDMILRLPNGYDTQIGPGGGALSGGERQRIALARAVFGDPRLVLLDEPNASLDNDGEQALLHAIEVLKQRGTTTVVIAHRASILRSVDKVLVLRDGAVQMMGPRDEVLAKLVGPRAAQQPAAADATAEVGNG